MAKFLRLIVVSAVVLTANAAWAASGTDPNDTDGGIDILRSSVNQITREDGRRRVVLRAEAEDDLTLETGKGSIYWQLDTRGSGEADYEVFVFGDPEAHRPSRSRSTASCSGRAVRRSTSCASARGTAWPGARSPAGSWRSTAASGGGSRVGSRARSTGLPTWAGTPSASPRPATYAGSPLTIDPPFITKGTASSAVMSSVGSPGTAIRSA